MLEEMESSMKVIEQSAIFVAFFREFIRDLNQIGSMSDLRKLFRDGSEGMRPITSIDENQRALRPLPESQAHESKRFQDVERTPARTFGPLGDTLDLAEIPRQERNDLVGFTVGPGT